MLPTITSVAGIPLSRQLDGMDLSHILLGKEGQDREQVLVNYGRGYFVRESRFRLNQDGKFYDIPVTSDKERYSEKVTTDPAHDADRRRLQAALDQFFGDRVRDFPRAQGRQELECFQAATTMKRRPVEKEKTQSNRKSMHMREASMKTDRFKTHLLVSWFSLTTVLLGWIDSPNLYAVEPREQPPNVLLLIVDDLNSWLLGDTNRYAGKVVAPNIRRLAESGVVFNRAYTPSPVCSPSRTALLSGVRPWQSGLYDNGVDIDASAALKTATPLPALLKQSGYSVWSYGKVAHGWDFRNACDEHISHKRDPNPPGAPFLPFTRGEQDWGPTHLSEEKMNDTSYADAAIRTLQKPHDRPFFVACGLFHPHMPWYVPQKYFDLFPPDVPLPEILDNDLDDVPPLGQAFTAGKSKFVEQVRKNGQHPSGVRAYLAATAYADAQMGRVLDALERSPYRDNTIVVLMSDHGFHLGEKNHWQKSTLWEEATHCLLMARVPGVTREGGKSERCVSLQDLYPTFVELCGLKPAAQPEGRSLVLLLKEPGAEWESTAITAFRDRNVSIRTERFRYIRYRDGAEELYDCTTDPHEWRNLAANPDYASALKELRVAVPPLSEMTRSMPTKRGARDE